MKLSLNNIEPFAVGYLRAKHDDPEYRIAGGFLSRAEYAPISINPDSVFAGIHDAFSPFGVQYTFGDGISVNEGIIQQEISQHPQYADELNEIYNKMKALDTNAIINRNKTGLERKLCEMKVCWGGNWGGHSNPDYNLFLHLGTNGIRKKIEKYRQINTDKEIFYDSLILSLDALDTLAQRYKKLAYDMAETADAESKHRLHRIAEALETVPQNPPKSFFEACQMFWLAFCFDGIDSPGRFDMFMIDYYRMSDCNDRKHCLEALWNLFRDTRTWNLCIGGSDENENDTSNELTYDILEVARKLKYNTPNLTMRVHKNTPEKLWRSAAETIATGIGMPVLYNDDCVVPALEALGIPPVDSHNYCMNGCNQIDIFGKSHMGLEDGEVCLAKCLELTLFNGVCSISGDAIGLKTGNPVSFGTYEELFIAYKKQVEYAADAAVEMANRSQKAYADFAPNPHRSNLIQGCIEKGQDYKNKGPLYGHGQILAEGIADTVDSLAAIKYYIYDTQKYTMSELINALLNDFNNYDELYHDFKAYKKFGNDEDCTNAIYKEVLEHFYQYLLTKRTFRGGIYGGGCSTFDRAADYGAKIGALPNGKRKNSTLLSDSIGAVPGADKNGPTALLNSVLSADHTLAKSGNVLNIKFNKDVFRTQTGLNAFISLTKTYFEKRGQQLSVNVVSSEELRDAQKNPQLYENLIVRVGGYSDFFTRLSPGLQENIIKRTEM